MTKEEWQTKFAAVVCEGLDKTKDYVVLAHGAGPHVKTRLAIRPMVDFLHPMLPIMSIAAKLSVFPEGGFSVEPINEETAASWLAETFPKFDFPKRGADRVGLVVGTMAPIPKDRVEEFRIAFYKTNVAKNMIEHLIEKGEISVENKELVIEALFTAYEATIEAILFAVYGVHLKTPEAGELAKVISLVDFKSTTLQ
jgi:hypothetical protein